MVVKEVSPEVFKGVYCVLAGEQACARHKPVSKPLPLCLWEAHRVIHVNNYLAWDDVDWLGAVWPDETTSTVTCNQRKECIGWQ